MSINHFMNKIKDNIGIDSTTFMCLLVIVLVGFSSFGLGRLSVLNTSNNEDIKIENNTEYNIKSSIGESPQEESIVDSSLQNVGSSKPEIQKERRYVASKNGKLYYTIGCSGAKRIAPKNEIWFADSEEANKAGYTLSKSCK